MEFRRRWHSFSLTELVIVLAVIGVLIAIGLFAFGSAQKTSRDQQRQLTVGKITNEITNYFRANSNYPATAAVVWSASNVTVAGTSISLPGYLSYSSSATDADQTRYYYSATSLGYVLCVKLESGTWYREASGSGACPIN